MFQRSGMEPGQDTTQFAIENPDVVEHMQNAYVEAGSDAIVTPTFNLNREKVAAMGGDLDEIIRRLTAPSIKVREDALEKGRPVIVGLDMGPQGELLEPMGKKTFEEACDFYAEMVRAGVKAGVDFVLIETMTDLYEAKAAVLAAKENSELPIMVSMSFEANGRTFVGTSLQTFALTMEGLGADAIGINCSLGPIQILPLIKELMTYTDLPVFAQPNAGLPDPSTGEYDIDCNRFVEEMKKYIDAGGLWNGGVFAFQLQYLLDKAHELIDFTDYNDLYAKYESLQKISFDYAVAEKEESICVMRFAGEWKDLGTWNTLTEAMEEPVIGKAVIADSCEDVHVLNELDMPILCMGLKNVIVSASPQGILVSDKGESSYIKPYVDEFDEQVMFAEKSWGSYQVIDVEDGSMTIRVTLLPGHSMNYHSHDHRDEVWTIIEGRGRTIVDGMEQPVKPGDVITMQAGCRHTIIADTELKLIEVQLGREISVHDKHKFELDR